MMASNGNARKQDKRQGVRQDGKGLPKKTCVLCAAIAFSFLGFCVGCGVCSALHGDAEQAAYERLKGDGNVPGTTTKAPGASAESYGGFQPSDSPPKCVPNGTVTYEIYDSAADMRYWVFRWPENGGYSVVPRLTTDSSGKIVPYEPPKFETQESTSSAAKTNKDAATTTTGAIEVKNNG